MQLEPSVLLNVCVPCPIVYLGLLFCLIKITLKTCFYCDGFTMSDMSNNYRALE